MPAMKSCVFVYRGMSLSHFHFLKIALQGIEFLANVPPPTLNIFNFTPCPLATIISDEKSGINIVAIPL